jgi:hypothetical protein
MKREILTYAQWALLGLAISLLVTAALQPSSSVGGMIFFGCLAAATAVARWIIFRREAGEDGDRNVDESS